MSRDFNNLDFRDYIAIVSRRRGTLLASFGGTLLVAILFALLWPPTYRSTGTILIEQQEIPDDFVRSAVSSYADQRIQTISQRVMTRNKLWPIIDNYGLYERERQRRPLEQIIEKMRDDIRLEMISADVVDPSLGRAVKATIAFSLSYDSHSPTLAVRVANELSSLFLLQNKEDRQESAQQTETFLESQANRLNTEIATLEAELAKFKRENVTTLPELTQMNMQLMNRTEEELRTLDTRLRSLREQSVYLQAQLALINPVSQVMTETGERVMSPADRLKVLRSELASARALYSPDHPNVLRFEREIAGLEREVGPVGADNDIIRELESRRGELAAAEQKYSADHPDVRRLRSQVAALEDAAATKAPPPETTAEPEADNPGYIQIRAQLEANQNEIGALATTREELKAEIDGYEARLLATPEIERQYQVLLRDLDNARIKYAEVRQKQLEAELAQALEGSDQGEQFTLIEPPLQPEAPASPNRPLILLLGLLISTGVGVGATALREATDETVRSRQDLFTLLDVPPLAVIPWMRTIDEQARGRRRLRLATAGLIGSIVVSLMLVHFFFRPLDVLWFMLMRRLGI